MAARVETYGNDATMNLDPILHQNIMTSHYFKELARAKSYQEVVDEIYTEVSSLEPWASPATKVPSTAFCLLYKLFTVRPTKKQMTGLLKHRDSPYIRALGFLYLRYCCVPKNLWLWFEPYLDDEEQFSPKRNGPTISMGKFARDLLVQQRHMETMLPRIPVPVFREIEQNLKEYDAAVKAEMVEEDKGGRDRSRERAGRERSRSRSRGREGRSRSRSRSRGRDSRDKPRYNDRDSDRRRDRRSRSRDRDYRRRDDRDSRSNNRDRDRDRDRNRDRVGRGRSRSRERRDRSRSSDRKRRDSRSRSKSQDRKRSRSLSPLSPRKEAKTTKAPSTSLDKLMEIYVKPQAVPAQSRPTSSRADSTCQEETIVLGVKK